MKRFLSITLLIAMLLTVFASCKGNENQGDPATAGADEIAMKSDNFSFNLAEATYAFNRTYIDFYNENYQYMNYYGIDKEKSLKEQLYTESNGTTWFDYFLNESKAYMHNMLLLCEAAKEAGLLTVQRFFIVDSHSFDTAIESVKMAHPDMIEVMPALVTREIKRLRESLKIPVIAGGLIEEKTEIYSALSSGASAVSTGKHELWE